MTLYQISRKEPFDMTLEQAVNGTMRLPVGLLRAICKQPTLRRDNLCQYIQEGHGCYQGKPLVVIVVPGFADSYELGLLDMLCSEIRMRIPHRLAPIVDKVDNPWPLEVDIPTYADQIHNFIQSRLQCYPGCRLALVSFSQGGTAALYYLSKFESEIATDHNLTPLVIALASPLYGSERFRLGFECWQRANTHPAMQSLKRLVGQLEPGSDIMSTVQDVMEKGDVHLLLSYNDPIVDQYTALPPGFSCSVELDIQAASSLKAHFDFPKDPSVINEVISLLGRHTEGYEHITGGIYLASP